MIEKYLIYPDSTVKMAIEKMTKANIKALIIVDDSNKVLGLFSNGDMRSYYLRGGNLSANILEAMNKTPFLYKSVDEVMNERRLFERVLYPIVDDNNIIVDIIDFSRSVESDHLSDALVNVPLVIMAGGKGTRLYPYTKILPKPLIPIGNVTITERIIDSFRNYGCRNIYMVLNYKANMIKAYMSELEKDYTINFIEEGQFLGTGGGLKLVSEYISSTFMVSNCDTLINADFECVYKTHKMKNNKITFVCSMKDVVIPYGIVETSDDGKIYSMKEKPEFSFLVNTGLYMLEPEVLEYIEDGEFIHLPDLAKRCLDNGENVGVFPIPDKAWMDMGQFAEMENMKKELGL